MIYTFYSYKGGVGRSMAVANIGTWYAMQGLRVLMVDWDLEAPGLESFFVDSEAALETIRSRSGLMDLILDYQEMYPTLPRDGDGPEPSASSSDRLEVLQKTLPRIDSALQVIKSAPVADAGGQLRLLSAGCRSKQASSHYASNVQSFRWADLYAKYDGEAYFHWLRQQLLSAADVVLIDSRTGVTEMGGVCTRQLADVVVSLCAPNRQNLRGVAEMAESINHEEVAKARRRRVDVLVVPARIDSSEIALRKDFFREYETHAALTELPPLLRELESSSSSDLRIPYIPKYAYGEKLAVGQTDAAEELVKAYRDLAIRLAVLAREGTVLRARLQGVLQSEFPQLVPAVLVVYAESDASAAAAALRDKIAAAGISVWQGIGAIEKDDPAQSATLLQQIRHLVIVLSPALTGSDALRQRVQEARRIGVWLHAVGSGSAITNLPAWLKDLKVLDAASDWSALHSLLQARVRAPRIPQMAPPPREVYVARAEFEQAVKAALLRSDLTPKVALWGVAGSGKSSLAASICRDEGVTAHFDGGIAWVTGAPRRPLEERSRPRGARADAADGGTDTRALCDELGKVYEAYTGETISFESVESALQEIGKAIGQRRALLVVDGVERVDDVATLSRGLPTTALLLTARDRQISKAVDATEFALGGMNDVEVHEFFRKRLTTARLEPAEISELGRKLEGLPLAMRLASGALAATDPTKAPTEVKRLLARLEAGGIDELEPSSSAQTGGFAVTLEQWLGTLNAEERQCLTDLAEYDEPVVSEETLRDKVWSRLGERGVRGLCARLEDYGLVVQDERGVRMHPLVRDYLRRRSQPRVVSGARDRARDILRGRAPEPGEILKLVAELKTEGAFSYARRLLVRLRASPSFQQLAADARIRAIQQLALCTYKDSDLPVQQRLDRALEILIADADLQTSRDPETIGLAGAIYKRKWEVSAQRTQLERSLAYYERGARASEPSADNYDFGYTAINAAFILDLLAQLEDDEARQVGTTSGTAAARRARAAEIRQSLCADLERELDRKERAWVRQSWWFFATLLEANFGLGRYREARAWVHRLKALPGVVDWELESSARQLAALARLRERVEPAEANADAWALIEELVGRDQQALRRLRLGKLGLALSGGGFRAALFHIGVLARLAEVDLLRGVEVLSCVSGGSIIGAHYYLEVRKLLREKGDRDVTRQDYINIVRRLESEFLAGVQTNLRTSVTSNVLALVRMIFDRRFTRTSRLGELYESRLFARVNDGEADKPRWMHELLIQPVGEPPGFRPALHNWRRCSKVPILVLNAATLNTGHAWYFTASYMGEPGTRIDTRIDGNDRLRTMYYDEAPPPHRRVRLGKATAASSAVPGLFEPAVFENLYPDRVVRLVDGGAYDNQGAAALIEQDCTFLLISDASGQMQSLHDPPNGVLGVALRANSMLQARLRLTQFQEVDSLRRSALLRGVMFVHLKKDLQVEPVDWQGCEDPSDPAEDARGVSGNGPLTTYGVRREVQEKLAAIRTDLDSFSDLEAYALMTSGYLMTEQEIAQTSAALEAVQGDRVEWKFLAVEGSMKTKRGLEQEHARLMAVLDAGSRIAFKFWILSNPFGRWIRKPLARLSLLIAAIVALLSIPIYLYSIGVQVPTLIGLGLVIFLGATVLRAGALFVLWVGSLLHVALFDRFYLRKGKVRLPREPLAGA